MRGKRTGALKLFASLFAGAACLALLTYSADKPAVEASSLHGAPASVEPERE